MKRSFVFYFLPVLGVVWSLGIQAQAQVTGLTPINASSANFAIGSQNGLVMEFQVTGSANGPDVVNYFNVLNNIVAAPAAQGGTGLPYDISAFKLWFQSGSSVFSPALSTPVTVTGTAPLQWGALSGNLPVTVGGYLFLTADIASSAVTGDVFEMTMPSSSVSFNTAAPYPASGTVTNTSPQTIVSTGTATNVALVTVPYAHFTSGSTNNLVLQLAVSTTGTAVFQTIQVNNTSTALASSDISTVKLWYQPGGGNFNASTAILLTLLTNTSSKSWSNTAAVNWNVNNGDNLYVTVDIQATGATPGDGFQFQIPSGGVVFLGGSLPTASLTNSAAQLIPYPTPTPTSTSTRTATSTPTSTASATPTLTPTSTPTSTSTPTASMTPTASFTPTNTASYTISPTSTSTFSTTPTPTMTLSPTPTPNAPLYLDSNIFNPAGGKSLGMDMRVDQGGQVKVTVFNIAGEKVKGLLDQFKSPGNYRISWDGHNDNGDLVGNAVYFIVIQTPSGAATRKVIVLK